MRERYRRFYVRSKFRTFTGAGWPDVHSTGHAPATFRSIKAFIQLLLQSELSHLHPSSCVCSNRCSALVTQRFLNRPGILSSTTSLHNAPRAAGTPLTQEDIADLIAQLAQSSQQLNVAVSGLTSSQDSFMRSAADADANIGLSKAHSLLPVEIVDVHTVDNTVNNDHRNGLPAALRDLRPSQPADLVTDRNSVDYDATDVRLTITYGAGHDDFTDDRADRLQSWHRNRGRGIRQLEKQLPADGYMNTVTPTVAHPDRQHDQWEGHPLTLQGSLNEGDVRKGEFTMSKFLNQNRWFTEYGKVYNAKQFILNMSTTHAEDLCNFASYDAYLTGSNKIFYLHEHFKSKVWKDVETSGFAHDSTFQIPYRPTSQLKLIHLTRMVNVTSAQHARYSLHNCAVTHAELRPGGNAGAFLPADNKFVTKSANDEIGKVWGRDAALLPNNSVLPKFRNNGFTRECVGASNVIRLAPVNPQFVRSQVLSRDEWQIYHRTIGGFARTYTEQQAVGREELDASTAIKQIDFALCDNCVWAVLFTVVSLTSEDVKSKLKTLRGQFDVMFQFYSPLVHPAHHFIAGPLALNTKILQYGTAKDQLSPIPLMDRLLTVLGLCFDSLKEGDRTPYNVALHEFMIDYNNRDDPRVTPKPQHKDAWQSPEALLQFAIDVYGQHKPEGLELKAHVNFRPAVFNEPVPASIQTYSTELDGALPSLFATSEGNSALVTDDANAQLLATIHRRSSGGGGKTPWKNNLGYHGSAAGGGNPSPRQVAPDRFDAKRREHLFLEVKQARPQVFPFKRGEQPPVVQPPRDASRSFQRSKSTPPPQHLNAPMAGRPSLTRHNAAAPNTMSDRHPHSSRTGAPDHQKMMAYHRKPQVKKAAQ